MVDIQKSPSEIAGRRRRRMVIAFGLVVVLSGAAYFITRLGHATPTVDRAGLWIDTVALGDVPRELRGVGELAPQDDASRWVSAELDGRVDRKLLERGAAVTPETVILQLSNRDVEQAAQEARLELQGAEAAYTSLEAALQSEVLALRSAAAAIAAAAERSANTSLCSAASRLVYAASAPCSSSRASCAACSTSRLLNCRITVSGVTAAPRSRSFRSTRPSSSADTQREASS